MLEVGDGDRRERRQERTGERDLGEVVLEDEQRGNEPRGERQLEQRVQDRDPAAAAPAAATEQQIGEDWDVVAIGDLDATRAAARARCDDRPLRPGADARRR